ncbi:tripartite tricarboxylate transporter TctB family protein [Agathobaculum desmolans]|uniref:tripartite tricarboxylate transporter TctB family protein n=1 Tax=Agathobaculum desmolans TaxID=39484 RepID=UPI0004E214E6|nr:tripartite tricarboxylate transporter TctB family protein [Agathobaculum desmolans]
MKIKYNAEIIAGAVFVIAATVLWLLIPSQIQTLEKTAINAQTFPRIAIGGMLIFSAGLLIQGIFFNEKKELVITKESFHSDGFKREMRSVIFAVMLLAYCVLVTFLGFIISTAILVVAILLFYGARKWYYYVIPLAMVGIVYYVFGVVLRISLP